MIVVPTIHPSALLRSSDDARSEGRFKHIVEADVQRAAALLRRKPDWDESPIWSDPQRALFPTLAQVAGFAVNALANTAMLWIDVEATGKHAMECELICVGIGYTDKSGTEHAMCVPFIRRGDRPYWAPDEEPKVRALIEDLVRSLPSGFQNGSFDTIVLWRHSMPVHRWAEDTMQAHHVVDGEMPHGLAFLASVYTEIPYYKDSVKGDEAWVHKDDLTLRLYNLRDVLCTMRSFPPLKAELENSRRGSSQTPGPS